VLSMLVSRALDSRRVAPLDSCRVAPPTMLSIPAVSPLPPCKEKRCGCRHLRRRPPLRAAARVLTQPAADVKLLSKICRRPSCCCSLSFSFCLLRRFIF